MPCWRGLFRLVALCFAHKFRLARRFDVSRAELRAESLLERLVVGDFAANRGSRDHLDDEPAVSDLLRKRVGMPNRVGKFGVGRGVRGS